MPVDVKGYDCRATGTFVTRNFHYIILSCLYYAVVRYTICIDIYLYKNNENNEGKHWIAKPSSDAPLMSYLNQLFYKLRQIREAFCGKLGALNLAEAV